MKKILLIFVLLVIITGCKEKEEEKREVIKSTGDLECVYKESRVDEDSMYTSRYLYKYNKNGILEEVINDEIVEFNENDKELKKTYSDLMKKANDEYKGINGVSTSTNISDNKYVLTITINPNKLDEDKKEDYLVNYDRINTYKIFKNLNYTCE